MAISVKMRIFAAKNKTRKHMKQNGYLEFREDGKVLISCDKRVAGEVSIPYGVTEVKSDDFQGCSCITSIELHGSLTEIRNSIFSGCCNLSFILIPNSVTWIGARAFENSYNLSSIEMPNTVKRIGENAFVGLINLKST